MKEAADRAHLVWAARSGVALTRDFKR
jgi:hypothetical protein